MAQHVHPGSMGTVTDLWHVSEALLDGGRQITPGRWWETIGARGAWTVDRLDGHPFFFRELMLETLRLVGAPTAVSRLSCCFTYEEQATAVAEAEAQGSHCYRIDPGDAAMSRHDILWISWIGEPGEALARIGQAEAYWRGDRCRDLMPEASEVWEVLVAGPLTIRERLL